MFAGDIFAPSKMAQHFKGKQMIAPFNACKVDVAMIGNHDLDFGMVQMQKLIEKCTTKEFAPVGVESDVGDVIGKQV